MKRSVTSSKLPEFAEIISIFCSAVNVDVHAVTVGHFNLFHGVSPWHLSHVPGESVDPAEKQSHRRWVKSFLPRGKRHGTRWRMKFYQG